MFAIGDRVKYVAENNWARDDMLVIGQTYTVSYGGVSSIRVVEGPNQYLIPATCFDASDEVIDPNMPRWVASTARPDSIVRMLTADEITARGGNPYVDTDGDFHQMQATPFRNGGQSFIPGNWLGQLLLLRDDGRCVRVGDGSSGKTVMSVLYVLDHSRDEGTECSHCGVEFGDEMTDGVCAACYDSTHTECDACRAMTPNDEMQDGMCQECYDDRQERCADCDETYPSDEMYERAGHMVCQRCSESYEDCNRCGRTYQHDEMEWNDTENAYYCSECAQRNVILSYNAKPTPVFFGTGPRYFGIELELDNAGESHENAAAIMGHEESLYAKHDGSLTDGFEVVSHPCSLEKHLGPDSVWPGVLKRAKALGYKSHNAGTCGLHVHISTKAFGATRGEQDLNIAKLLLVFDRQWANILKLSRRSSEQAERWACHYVLGTLPEDGTPDETNMALRDEKGRCEGNGRYQAVNLENRHTVEVRIMRGTLNEQSFRATLQFCDALVDMVTTRTVYELLDMSWTTMRRTWFNKYAELKAYCIRRMGEDELIDGEDDRPAYVAPPPPAPPQPDWAHASRSDRSMCEQLAGYVPESAAELWGLGATDAAWNARMTHNREAVAVYVDELRAARAATTEPPPAPRFVLNPFDLPLPDPFVDFRNRPVEPEPLIPELTPSAQSAIDEFFASFRVTDERGTV